MPNRITALIMAFVALMAAPSANAEPKIDGEAIVCDTFDEYGVNVQSVKWIGDYLMARKGLSVSRAITTIEVAVILICPNHEPAFDALVAQLEKEQNPGNPLFE